MIKQERSDDTKRKYHDRAVSLMIKAYNECLSEDHHYSENTVVLKYKGDNALCLDLKYAVIWASTKWSKKLRQSSWRYYRASFMFMSELFLEKGKISQSQFEKIRLLLEKTRGEDKDKLEHKTSSNKKKSFNIKEIKKIDDYLKKSKNKWANPLRLWIRSGSLIGLRPQEWKDVQLKIDEKIIIIKNAKNTNGRSLGEHRTINLSHLEDEKINDIEIHIKISDNMHKKGIWDIYYQGCSNLLKYSARKIWTNKSRYPSLYSCRHQFSANMKASGCTKKEVAALMGHASDLTAQEHYGRKIHGSRGRKPEVNKNDLSKVKTNKKESFKFTKNKSK
jgi:integrase